MYRQAAWQVVCSVREDALSRHVPLLAPRGGSLGLGQRVGRVALTKKLLSLGLVARLRPRRMLSFRSDTLDRVTLPEEGGRSSACSPPAHPPAESAAAAGHQRCLWPGWCQAESSPALPADLHGLLRPHPDVV